MVDAGEAQGSLGAQSGEQRADFMRQFESSDDQNLDPQQRQTVEAFSKAFFELEKLVKNIVLYGRGHQSVDRFRDRFFSALTSALIDRTAVEIRIGPYEFSVFRQTIYENPNPEGNFIYKFYLDGLRRLTFYQGISEEDVNNFVDILLVDWSDPIYFEDDAVTLFWEKNFESLHYTIIDTYSADTRATEGSTGYSVAEIIDQVRRGGVQSKEGGRRVNLANISLSDEDVSAFEEVPFAMDAVEFETLKRRIITTDRETLEKFIEIIFKVSMLEQATEERDERIVGLFARIADLLLDEGRIGDLERFLRKIRRLKGRDGRLLQQNVEAIERIFRHWSNQPFVERLTSSLNEPDFIYTPSVLAICRLLNRGAVRWIALYAGRVRHEERRNKLLKLIPAMIKGEEVHVARLLGQVDGPYAMVLFRIIQKLSDPRAMAIAVTAAMGNSDHRVRLAALSAIPKEQATRHVNLLIKALDDSAKPVRGKSLRMLARISAPEVHQRLLERIDGREFVGYDLDEKRQYFVAAALTGDSNEHFLEMFSSGKLLSRKGYDEVRHAAAVGLAIRLFPQGREAMEREMKRRLRSEIVVDACRWGLAHMASDRKTRTRQIYDIFIKGELTA